MRLLRLRFEHSPRSGFAPLREYRDAVQEARTEGRRGLRGKSSDRSSFVRELLCRDFDLAGARFDFRFVRSAAARKESSRPRSLPTAPPGEDRVWWRIRTIGA